MKFNCTGVILAGGKNSRLPGKKKTFRKIGDLMILESIHKVFSSLFKEVIIVVNEPEEFAGWDMTVVTDIIPSQCALAGLHAGLFYASCPYAYVTACDTPFVKLSVIEHIVRQIEPGYDVIIPRTDDGLETLSAVYSKDCIPLIESNLEKDIFMIKKFFRRKKVKEIPVEHLKKLDPQMRFIFNINTPGDLEKAKNMANRAGRQKGESYEYDDNVR
ncbi:MAG: molybdenum cofactor guanylyltransferase [Deltaproteobacteria bacterium]|nr:molybdenum cofactor guanylyltransferase [Deltaproteobacteria bacterium]